MAIFLIDPFDQKVSDVQESFDSALEAGEDLLELIRKRLAPSDDKPVRQVSIIAANQNRIVLFVDNFGMLKGEQEFWRFAAGGDRIAGRALMFAIEMQSGRIAPLHPDMLADVQAAIVWDEGVYLLRIHEQILTEPGEVPAIARIPVFSDDPNPKVLQQLAEALEGQVDEYEPKPNDRPQPPLKAQETTFQPDGSHAPVAAPALDSGWIVRSLASGSVQAVRYTLESDSIRPSSERLTAETLADLRRQMPEGYERREPDDDAPPDVLELWVLPVVEVDGATMH